MDDIDADTSAGAAVPAPTQRPGTTAPAPDDRPKPPPPTVLPQDEWAGLGGDYVIGEDGIRRPAV